MFSELRRSFPVNKSPEYQRPFQRCIKFRITLKDWDKTYPKLDPLPDSTMILLADLHYPSLYVAELQSVDGFRGQLNLVFSKIVSM